MFPSIISEISNSDIDTTSQQCTKRTLLPPGPGVFPILLSGKIEITVSKPIYFASKCIGLKYFVS